MSVITARAVLFGDTEPTVVLGRSAAWRDVLDAGLGGPLAALSKGGRQAAHRELESAFAGLLELDLGQLLLGGWRRHRALLAAAASTEANPTATEHVQLAAHRIVTGHRPYAEIAINAAVVATVHFDLGLTFDIDTIVATVRQGRLVALQSGRCTLTISLGCEGRELASRQLALDIAATVRLGQGIPLRGDTPPLAIPRPSQPSP